MQELAEKIINNMTIEEKVGQLFFITPETLAKRKVPKNRHLRYLLNKIFPRINSINKKQIKTLKKYHVGGLILFQRHFVTRDKLVNYLNDLQANSKFPLFFACDEEGGYVRRLSRVRALEFPNVPHMSEIGETGDINKAYEIGEMLGQEMTKLGFNVNFAPVADIYTRSSSCDNKNLSNHRYFGDNPKLVSEMVSAIVEGMQKNNLSATLKHFPGHGDTVGDSHLGVSASNIDLETLRSRELLPFKAGIDAGADFVMAGHQSLPNILNNNMPCCMSKFIITDILRKELKYDRIIICDSLNMNAILDYYNIKDVLVSCINAGVDMIMMPPNLKKAYKAIKKQVQNGGIPMEVLDNAVRRIINIKIKQGLITE